MRNKVNRTKVTLTCEAPMHLTEHNEERNKKVHETCSQDPKFHPRLSCFGCEYLETTTYFKKKGGSNK